MTHFGTDGIRKKSEEFTPELLAKIIRGLTNYAGSDKKVLLGGDTRESTEWIIGDLESALETYGFEYASVGILPTPAINYCFYEMGFDFAIDVTASHNPYIDNGIKIFERGDSYGIKLSEAGKAIVEESLSASISYDPVSPTLRENLHDEAVKLYTDHLKSYLGEADFTGLGIALDCANGATSVINQTIFEELGATVTLINADSSYGQKINENSGSTHLDSLKTTVKDNHLDLGIAFDGDGDRVLMVDENGSEIDGDQIIAILAHHLRLNHIAVTIMSNQGLLNWAKDNNIKTEITDVGDSNVAEAMRKKGIHIGGEQSGHIILPNESTGDGMLTALMVVKVISKTKNSLKSLATIYQKSPQVILNMPATPEQKQALKSSEEVKNLLLDYAHRLESESGRLLVRPSGTENLIRITVWGNDASAITTLAEELKTKLGELL